MPYNYHRLKCFIKRAQSKNSSIQNITDFYTQPTSSGSYAYLPVNQLAWICRGPAVFI
jgi:hypothetical protein